MIILLSLIYFVAHDQVNAILGLFVIMFGIGELHMELNFILKLFGKPPLDDL